MTWVIVGAAVVCLAVLLARRPRGVLPVDEELVPPTDEEFRGEHESFGEGACTPLVPDDFRGLVLAGPTRVPYHASIRDDWDGDWVQLKVPRFIVAGHYCFSGEEIAALPRDPLSSIELVIENTQTGEVSRRIVDDLFAEYRYVVIGIDESPAEPPTPDDFDLSEPGELPISIGGYFNAPMGLFVTEPESPYELRVHAECGEYRSNVVSIEIVPDIENRFQ